MSSARTPLPTDIVALVSFDGRVYPNEAKPLDRLGSDDHTRPLENALEQWFSFATGKHAWVSVRGATIRGLISARRRAKRSAWEVEVLIDADDDAGVVLSLFSRMVAGITQLGAERVFLRVEADSPLIEIARAAGFFPFQHETLYACHRIPEDAAASSLPLRPRRKEDALGLFHLYSHTTPANVRAIEGLTLREWQAAQESWGKRPADLVLEDDGAIAGWLRFSRGGTARLAAYGAGSELDALASSGLTRLADSREVQALVPDHSAGLAAILEERGFEPVSRYASLAKRLIKPVEELAAEPAQTPVPVSQ